MHQGGGNSRIARRTAGGRTAGDRSAGRGTVSRGRIGGLLALIALLAGAIPAAAETSWRATIGDWQVLTQSTDEGASDGTVDRCLARAIHPAIATREVLWIVDPALFDRYPDGLLRVSRSAADGVDTVLTVAIDGTVLGRLAVGFDGAYYSDPALAGALRPRLAEASAMTLTPDPDGPSLTVSLSGGGAAIARAAALCAG